MNRIKVLFTQKEVDYIVNDLLGSQFMRMGDDGLTEKNTHFKFVSGIEHKILKSMHKSGRRYLWDKEVKNETDT